MGRRGSQNDDSPVSLFPFLSILACMIGTLTLMITGLALTGMDADVEGRDEESVRRAEDFMLLKRKRGEYRQQIDDLRRSSGEQGNLDAKLADARRQLETLERSVKSRAERQKLESDLKQKVDENQKALAASNAEKDRLEKELNALREEVAGRQQRLSGAMLKVLPPRHGKAIKYKPHFVETRSTGLVLYSGEQPHVVAAGAIGTDKALNDLLGRLSGQGSEQLVLLIRKDGLAARHKLLQLAEQQNVACGQIPLVDGSLDLSGVKQ